MKTLLKRLWPFQRRLGKTYRVIGVTADRRNKAQLEAHRYIKQERADAELERLWRQRIKANEMARIARKYQEAS